MWPSSCSPHLLVGLLCLVTVLFDHVRGHGRLWEPPSRSSMWRRGFNTSVNYQDMELFCGGVKVQYDKYGGKCGVCGDPWNGSRENEAGGKYATGIIVRKYDVGQVINVTIDLTANHKGYFEFHLCPKNQPFAKITEACLAKYPLVEVSTGKTRYPVPDTEYNSKIDLRLRLPQQLRCRACMLQWKYNAGNSWGTDPDGTACIGCGKQEQFYGCADIAIGHDGVVVGKVPEIDPLYTDTEEEIIDGPNSGNNSSEAAPSVYQNKFTQTMLTVIHFLVVIVISLAST